MHDQHIPDSYYIVSFDGATPEGGGFITAGLLHDIFRRLHQKYTRFLDTMVRKTRDKERIVFAGTSSGGWTALYLAAQDKPDAVLRAPEDAWTTNPTAPDPHPSLLRYWRDLTDAMSPMNSSLARLAGAAAGACAVSSSRILREFFIETFGEKTRLGDLPHKVFITSFQLDNQAPRRFWTPKFFCNFGANATNDELVVDVALRTSSAPVWLPVFQSIQDSGPGYLDGGVFANNPSMCVLGAVVEEMQKEAAAASKAVGETLKEIRDAVHESQHISDRVKALVDCPMLERYLPTLLPMVLRFSTIRLLSLGNGISSTFIDIEPIARDGVADWGYGRWLLDFHQPALLIHLIWKAGEAAVHQQCDAILGPDVFRRLQPFLPCSFEEFSGEQAVQAVRRMWAMDWTEGEIDGVIEWMDQSGWCSDPPTPRRNGRPPRPKPGVVPVT